MQTWFVSINIYAFVFLMVLVGALICLPFILIARRFGYFFFITIFYICVIGLLEVGYANLFSYYFVAISDMDNLIFLRFVLGGFGLIVGFVIDFAIITFNWSNTESESDNKEGFLDMVERIHQADRDQDMGIRRSKGQQKEHYYENDD